MTGSRPATGDEVTAEAGRVLAFAAPAASVRDVRFAAIGPVAG